MEIWDAYDEHFNIVEGVSLLRGQSIPEGLFHLAAEIVVRHTDGEFLLMQRAGGKNFGGMWELTAGGAALKGETPLMCALRELREETGILAEKLTELGHSLRHEYQTIFAEYLCETNVAKDSIRLQKGETFAYKWLPLNRLQAMSKDLLTTQNIKNFVAEGM